MGISSVSTYHPPHLRSQAVMLMFAQLGSSGLLRLGIVWLGNCSTGMWISIITDSLTTSHCFLLQLLSFACIVSLLVLVHFLFVAKSILSSKLTLVCMPINIRKLYCNRMMTHWTPVGCN